MGEDSSYVVDSMIKGYHVYKSIWDAPIGEQLDCMREPGNSSDPYAVAVVKPPSPSGHVSSSLTVGHVPRKIYSPCSMFLQRGGTILCTVTRGRRFSNDLSQGGLEVLCQLKFIAEMDLITKISKLLKGVLVRGSSISSSSRSTSSSCNQPHQMAENQASVIVVEDTDDVPQLPSMKRKISDQKEISTDISSAYACHGSQNLEATIMGQKLSDLHINWAQNLLKKQFPSVNGLASTLLITKDVQITTTCTANKIQIFHSRKDHWITASSVTCRPGKIQVYDSSYTSLDIATKRLIHKEFQSSDGIKPVIDIVPLQKQKGSKDCGLFAIAYATSIAFGIDPTQKKLKQDSPYTFNKML